MPINFAAINLVSLGLLCGLVFVASLIGQSLVGGNRVVGAVLAVIIFAAIYIFWNHYPHGLMPGLRFPA